VKVIRDVVRIRKKDPKERGEAESLLDNLLARNRHGGTVERSSVSFRICRESWGRLQEPPSVCRIASAAGWRMRLLESAAVGTGSGDRPFTTVLYPRRVMVLWGSVAALLASVAGLVTLGSIHIVGDLAALVFVISLFTLICATEARS